MSYILLPFSQPCPAHSPRPSQDQPECSFSGEIKAGFPGSLELYHCAHCCSIGPLGSLACEGAQAPSWTCSQNSTAVCTIAEAVIAEREGVLLQLQFALLCVAFERNRRQCRSLLLRRRHCKSLNSDKQAAFWRLVCSCGKSSKVA